MANNGEHGHDHHGHDTYSASEVAEVLGLGKRRVLQMLEREELAGEKDAAGRWIVFAPHVHALLQERQQQDRRRGRAKDAGEENIPPVNTEIERELLDSLKDQVLHLRDQLAAEREANRENRRIIAGLIERIPELEAPRDERESPEKPAEEPSKGTDPEPQPPPQTSMQRRPWWRRILGG